MTHIVKTTKKEYEKAIDLWFDVLGFAPCVKHFDFDEKNNTFDYELYDKDESVCENCKAEFCVRDCEWRHDCGANGPKPRESLSVNSVQKFVNDEITIPEIKPESTSVPIENTDWLRAYT